MKSAIEEDIEHLIRDFKGLLQKLARIARVLSWPFARFVRVSLPTPHSTGIPSTFELSLTYFIIARFVPQNTEAARAQEEASDPPNARETSARSADRPDQMADRFERVQTMKRL